MQPPQAYLHRPAGLKEQRVSRATGRRPRGVTSTARAWRSENELLHHTGSRSGNAWIRRASRRRRRARLALRLGDRESVEDPAGRELLRQLIQPSEAPRVDPPVSLEQQGIPPVVQQFGGLLVRRHSNPGGAVDWRQTPRVDS